MPSRSAARPRKSDSTVIELPITPKTEKGTQAPSTATKTAPPTKSAEAKAVEKPAKPKSKARSVTKEAVEPKDKVAAKPVAEKPAAQIELPRAEAPAPKVEAAISEKPPVKKPAVRPASSEAQQISPEERQRLVAEAAYYIAERRGFATGYEQEDWLAAEAEVEQRLKGSTK